MMRQAKISSGRRRAAAIALVALLALAVGAFAFWSTHGSATASASIGRLNHPTGVSAATTSGSSSVSVSWSASTPAGGVSPSGYYVRRWSGSSPTTASGTCGSPSAPVNQTSCTDTGVADGTYTYTVVALYRSWTAESSHSSSVTVVGDTTPPTTTITLSPASANGSNGWYKTAPTFTLSATDAGTGVASTKYQIDGGAVQAYTGSPVSIADGTHTVSYWSVDKAGNTESTKSTAAIKVDTVAPTTAISLGGSPSHALLSGSTLYFNSATSGSFTLVNTVGDVTSGAASATFPLVSATNWTHAAQTVTTPSGGPYGSGTYSWTSGAGTPSGAQTSFTSADAAGNSSAATVLTFTPDTTAPTGGALSVNGTAATAAGSTSTSTSTSFAIGTRTDYTETQTATQSGLASSSLTIQSETLSANGCGTPGSGGAYTTATTIAGTSNPTIATGFCYLYTLTGTDNVGNAAIVKTTVKVDTTAPSSPTVSLSAATGSTFVSGTSVYINAQAGREGSFKATASSADAETGVTSIALPSLTGFSGGGGTLGSPFETTYTWSGAASASGAQSAVATNGAGLSATNASAFTVNSDTTAPSGGSVSVPSRANAATASVTFSSGTDTGSGVNTASGQLLRAEATYTASSDTCGSFGTFANDGAAGKSSPASDTVVSGRCYEYEYAITDNVGNSTTYGPSGVLKVNTSGPALTAISSTNGNGIIETGDILTLSFNDTLSASSVPASGTIGQAKSGNGAQATVTITGITGGTEGWSTGITSGYQEKQSSVEYNETASVSGATVKVTVGTKVKGSGSIAGGPGTVTGTVNPGVKDLFENAASTSSFSLSAKLW